MGNRNKFKEQGQALKPDARGRARLAGSRDLLRKVLKLQKIKPRRGQKNT